MENQSYLNVGEEETGFGFDERNGAEGDTASLGSTNWLKPAMVLDGQKAASGKQKKKKKLEKNPSLADAVSVRMDIQKKSDVRGAEVSHLLESWYESDLAKMAPGKEFMLVCSYPSSLPLPLFLFLPRFTWNPIRIDILLLFPFLSFFLFVSFLLIANMCARNSNFLRHPRTRLSMV